MPSGPLEEEFDAGHAASVLGGRSSSHIESLQLGFRAANSRMIRWYEDQFPPARPHPILCGNGYGYPLPVGWLPQLPLDIARTILLAFWQSHYARLLESRLMLPHLVQQGPPLTV